MEQQLNTSFGSGFVSSVMGRDSKWLLLSGKHNELHLLRRMMPGFQHSPCTTCDRQRLSPRIWEQRRLDSSMLYRVADSYIGQWDSRGKYTIRQDRSSLADRAKSRAVFQSTNHISARQVSLAAPAAQYSHEGRDRASPSCSST